MSNTDLESVRAQVALLQWCKQQKAKIKEVEDSARAAVESAMGNASVGMLDDEMVISWDSHKRNAFDSSAFRDDHPDLYEEYKALKSVRRFEVL